jgi:hypothetical protein
MSCHLSYDLGVLGVWFAWRGRRAPPRERSQNRNRSHMNFSFERTCALDNTPTYGSCTQLTLPPSLPPPTPHPTTTTSAHLGGAKVAASAQAYTCACSFTPTNACGPATKCSPFSPPPQHMPLKPTHDQPCACTYTDPGSTGNSLAHKNSCHKLLYLPAICRAHCGPRLAVATSRGPITVTHPAFICCHALCFSCLTTLCNCTPRAQCITPPQPPEATQHKHSKSSSGLNNMRPAITTIHTVA